MSPAEMRFISLEDAPGENFILFDEFGHSARHLLREHAGGDAVLTVQVDIAGIRPFQAALHRFADGLRAAVRQQSAACVLNAALGGRKYWLYCAQLKITNV